ncbi:discoidin domain-containing protein [Cryobacterium sp. Y11]|uniref:GH39 family glycosyl hydrolase n=1 Tax=Cryobacterium sp. Y11 TaxID=2045016 RepID=UPI0013047C90|nr:discoidin domain-containing protein [Cryobacterium sp. Y11]
MYPPQPAFAASSELPGASPVTAAGTNATLSADLAADGSTLNVANLLNASQGGYGATRNLNWFSGQSAQMSSMGLTEIRVDHVFDDAYFHVVNLDATGAIAYDFTALDRVLLPLIENGLQPFISLSYMPSALGADTYGPPKSLDAWGAAVSALVTHYSDLGHSGWGYEVWNEPDTFHWNGTNAQYNELYAASAAAVKAADPTALIGGGSTSSLDSFGNIPAKLGLAAQFIAYLGANPSVPADFFSVHGYWAPDWPEIPQARQLLDAAGRTGLPIYVTEWSELPSMEQGAGNGADTNASNGGASFVAKRMFLAIDSGATKIFHFTPIEGYSPQLAYNGDLGLITVDGHRKSAGNVFELYSRLGQTRVAAEITGAGTDTNEVSGLVTKDSATSKVSTLLYNHTASDVTMAVDLAGLPFEDSNFRVTERVVSSTQGNGFADGSDFIVPSYPSQSENAPIVSDTVHRSAQSYAQDVRVPAHGVVTVEIAASSQAAGKLAITAQPAQTNLAATALGGVPTASTSLEQPEFGWGIARLTDGQRHEIEFGAHPIRGYSSQPQAAAVANEWAQIDLGSEQPVDTVVLWPRDSQVQQGSGFPDDFTIEGSSNGIDWNVLTTKTGYTAGVNIVGAQQFEFKATELRYLKVAATLLTDGAGEQAAQFALQLAEITAYRNGLVDGGFESGNLKAWKVTGDVTVQSASVRGGLHAVALSGDDASVSMRVEGLLPNTTYTFGGYVRPETADDVAVISVSGFGSKTQTATMKLSQWAPTWVTFTTGAAKTSAVIEFSKPAGAGSAWGDDFVLTQGTTAPEAE